MRPADFWPFAEEWDCQVCGEPVSTRDGVAVVNDGRLGGLAHPECMSPEEFEDGDPVQTVDVQDGLL